MLAFSRSFQSCIRLFTVTVTLVEQITADIDEQKWETDKLDSILEHQIVVILSKLIKKGTKKDDSIISIHNEIKVILSK